MIPVLLFQFHFPVLATAAASEGITRTMSLEARVMRMLAYYRIHVL